MQNISDISNFPNNEQKKKQEMSLCTHKEQGKVFLSDTAVMAVRKGLKFLFQYYMTQWLFDFVANWTQKLRSQSKIFYATKAAIWLKTRELN